MKVNAISFCNRQEKIQKQQEFDEKRDQMLDMALLQMLPEFMNGDADILIINSKSSENGEVNMDINVRQRQPRQEFSEEASYLWGRNLYQEVAQDEVIYVEPKKTLVDRIKSIFKK